MTKGVLRKMAKFKVIKNRRAYLRRRRFRRFLTLATIVTIFAYAAHTTYAIRVNRLNSAREELASYQEKYDEIMLRQEFYENQVIRLEDEDYIAMLARERHFRALPNEIVFRFVDDSILSSVTTETFDADVNEDYEEDDETEVVVEEIEDEN